VLSATFVGQVTMLSSAECSCRKPRLVNGHESAIFGSSFVVDHMSICPTTMQIHYLCKLAHTDLVQRQQTNSAEDIRKLKMLNTVLMPSPFSKYTTSSVEALPVAPDAYIPCKLGGGPPRPAILQSITLIPICHK